MTARRSTFDAIVMTIGLILATYITVVTPVPCVPVEGKTALTIGQDFYSITNYSRAMGPILGKVRPSPHDLLVTPLSSPHAPLILTPVCPPPLPPTHSSPSE